jgi:hypothetical protein
MLGEKGLPKEFRKKLKNDREEALRFEANVNEWKKHYQRAIEYPASRIFVALRDGTLNASGKLLPAFDLDEAIAKLSKDELDIFDIEPTSISPTFWSLQGIDFEKSAARNEWANYCHITLATEELLSVFPGEGQQVAGVERVGYSFMIKE